jgi:hypothetical protein
MKVLELFAGSRSIGTEAERQGHRVCSIDVKPFEGINIVMDCEDITLKDLPFIPDMFWSGTPCTTYSLAAISHHRNIDRTPKTDFAAKCDRMNINNLKLLKELLEINPKLIWYIENPRAVLRKMDFMKGLPVKTITYCSYGDIANKPTDIFSNNHWNPLFNPQGWEAKPMCPRYKYDLEGNVINKHCHHEPAQSGSSTGTQGKKDNYERSKYPELLCKEIIEVTAKKISNSVQLEIT